jgi:hypothetical protein
LKTYSAAIGAWAFLSLVAAGCHDNLNGPDGSGGSGGRTASTGGAGGTSCGQVPLCYGYCANDPIPGVCNANGTVGCPSDLRPEPWCNSSGTGGSVSTGGSSATGGSSGTGGLSGTGGSSGTGGLSGTGGSSATGGHTGGAGSFGSGGSTGLGGAGGRGGAAGAGGGGAPSKHRPTATICSAALADAGAPKSGWDGGLFDLDPGPDGGPVRCNVTGPACPPCANGLQARCYLEQCLCDECNSDKDCANGGVCSCGLTLGQGSESLGNICIPANCRIDSDCGPGGYCSPTVSNSCGAAYGVQGYYCHTPGDTCRNDTDCAANAYCAYSPQAAIWACATGLCAG